MVIGRNVMTSKSNKEELAKEARNAPGYVLTKLLRINILRDKGSLCSTRSARYANFQLQAHVLVLVLPACHTNNGPRQVHFTKRNLRSRAPDRIGSPVSSEVVRFLKSGNCDCE